MELVFLNSLIENEERIKKGKCNEILTINSINLNGIDCYVKLDIVLKETITNSLDLNNENLVYSGFNILNSQIIEKGKNLLLAIDYYKKYFLTGQ